MRSILRYLDALGMPLVAMAAQERQGIRLVARRT